MALDGLMQKYGMGGAGAGAAPADPLAGADDLADSLTAEDGTEGAGGAPGGKLGEALAGIGHSNLDPKALSEIQAIIDGAGGASNTLADDESLEGSDPMADDGADGLDIAKGGIAQGVKPKPKSKFGAMGA